MSTRDYMLSLRSIDPVKNAVGSKDQQLLDALLQGIGDDEEHAGYVRAMIFDAPPAKEPGCWNFFVEPIAEYYDLSPHRLPLEDWKHYYVWDEYRENVDRHVSPDASRLLELMELGRPFQGAEIDHDGCAFAWLTAEEAASLLAELSAIDDDALGELEELDEFHEVLVESLQEAVDRKDAVFLGAC